MRSRGKLQRDRRQGDHNSVEGVAGNCSEHNFVKEDDSVQVDLRVLGVSQDVIYRDEGRLTKIQTLVDRLQDGSRTKSIMNDLKQDGLSNVFSEASRLEIKEMGNIELYELGETVRTNQCPTCLRRSKEGKVYCVGGGLMKSGSIIIGKPKMQQKMVRNENTQQSRKDGEMISFKSGSSTGTWMDSRVLHFLGLPQNSRNRVQGD